VRGAATLRPLIVLAMSLAPPALLADVGDATTIASGLRNPRGIAFAPNGALHVAEAGSGGAGPCTPSPVPPNLLKCYGETGAVTRSLPDGSLVPVVTGLPSFVLPDGTVEGGPVDVAFFGMAATVTLGLGGDPAVMVGLAPKSHLLGKVLHTTPSGQYKVVADIAGHEATFNPYGGPIDSNPYNTLVQPGRRIVADAGANALIEVLANGRTRTFAVLPPRTDGRQPVTTSIAEGPDGGLYAGLLTGFPFWRGTASVVRFNSDGSGMQTAVDGLTAVVDVTFDTGGAMYILEIASGQVPPFPPPSPGLGAGRLKRVCPGGSPTVLVDGLTFSSGVAIGPDHAAYLTNFGTSPSAGEVLRLPLTPCP
jgi:hypothetical protein